MSRTQRVRFPAADGVVHDGRLRRPDGRSRGSARVTDWVGIAPAVGPTPGVVLPPLPEAIAGWAARRTVIVGEHDGFYPVARMSVLARHALDVLPGADHFLFDRADDVAARVAAALRARVPA